MADKLGIKTFRYRVLPTQEQEQLFLQWAGCRRWVFNWGLERKKSHYQATGQSLSYKDLAAELTQLKREEFTSWLAICSAQVLQQSLQDLERAFRNFCAGRTRFPRFKAKRSSPPSFRFPQDVRVRGDQLILPKIGAVALILHRPLEGILKSATLKREPTGHWFICLVCQVKMQDLPTPSCDNPVGIDIGLKDFATFSTGEKEEAPRFYRKQQAKLRRAQRKVSRRFDASQAKARQPQSQNYQKAKAALARLHAAIRQKRLDFLHKLTTRLVKVFDLIAIEDLNVSALTRTKLRGHSKSWSDVAASTFRRLLTYKCDWWGKSLMVTDRWFPSSKRCSNPECHYLYQELTLSQTEWTCPKCGRVHDRNLNASLNLRDEGVRLLTEGLSAVSTPVEAMSDSPSGSSSRRSRKLRGVIPGSTQVLAG
jgi:putative transposase